MTEAHTLDDRIMAFDPAVQRGLVQYVRQWFAPEDDVLQTVRRNALAQGLPEIQIRPEEGQMLQFLVASIHARRILEIGTLAGYSGIWLARALPPDGSLITLERDARHARIAHEHFALAGVADRVEILEGDARHSLAMLGVSDLFDMVFIDADKEDYPEHLAWALDHVRAGGLITAHNAFRSGKLLDAEPDGKVHGTRLLLETMARSPRLVSTIIPVGDGIAAGVVQSA